MLFNPSFNRLKHPTRMLNIPEDARVRSTVIDTKTIEPVRVDFTSVRLPAGVVFVPPVGHGDVAVTHDCLPEEIKAVIFVEKESVVGDSGVEFLPVKGFADCVEAVKLMVHGNTIDMLSRLPYRFGGLVVSFGEFGRFFRTNGNHAFINSKYLFPCSFNLGRAFTLIDELGLEFLCDRYYGF